MKIIVKLLKEAGYNEALLGLSLNKNQPLENMPDLLRRLSRLDNGHNKAIESIMIWLDVTAPRYWWSQADCYRLSTKQSESTMHTIMKRLLRDDDFEENVDLVTIQNLNQYIMDKDFDSVKANLPEGFLQRRIWVMSYKTLRNIIIQRSNHKLPHWRVFVKDVLEQVEHPELLPEGTRHE